MGLRRGRALLLASALAWPAAAEDGDAERSAAGRRLYRDGVLPSGVSVGALVAGDVPVTGPQLRCQGCHGRSGMGAAEGGVRVPPVGALLFEPSAQRRRGAYDDAALARALREGVDAAGRSLDPLMPRYRLGDEDVAALGAYLRRLSAESSPGVTDEEIRLATVVSEDVPESTRASVLTVIARFVEEKNRETRLERRRPGHGAPPGERRPTTYRRWAHEVWTLSGSPATWPEQLEARYGVAPVFALLGGLGRSWDVVSAFCERHEVPGFLPSVDLPASEPGWYTAYFSRGLTLEADLVEADLGPSVGGPVVQIYRPGTSGEAAAARLYTALRARGVTVRDERLGASPSPRAGRAAAEVIWLDAEDLARTTPRASRIYVSSTLLDRDFSRLPDRDGVDVRAAHPFALPDARDPALDRFRRWMSLRGLPIHDERRQAEAFFACLAAHEALGHLGRFVVRDYALDSFDHAQALPSYLPIHAPAGLGPGQRFLAKSGYVVPVRGGRLDAARAVRIAP